MPWRQPRAARAGWPIKFSACLAGSRRGLAPRLNGLRRAPTLPSDSQMEAPMARTPKNDKPQLPSPTKSDRERIIETFVALLAEKPFESIGFGEIAARSGLSL